MTIPARRMSRRPVAAVTSLVLASLAVAFSGLGVSPAAAASSYTPAGYAARMAELVNQARTNNGVPALAIASGTTQVAQAWADHVTATGTLGHNPDLANQLQAHGSPNWTYYSENVGYGRTDDPDSAFAVYMQTSPLRDHVLDSREHFLGVGIGFSGSRAYNVLDFVDSYGVATATPTPTQPSPTASAVVVASPTGLAVAAPAPTSAIALVPSPTATEQESAGPSATPAVASGVSDSGLLVGFEGTKRFLVFCGAGLIAWMGLLNLFVGARSRRRRGAPTGPGGTAGPGLGLSGLLAPESHDPA